MDVSETLLEPSQPGPALETLRIGATSWSYLAAGSGSATLLVLGGGLSTAQSSRRLIDSFATQYRVLAPSYPAGASLTNVLDGLAALLDQERVRHAHVLGHSLGAGIAHLFVRRHPARVDRLALSGFGLYTPGRVRLMRASVALFRLLPYSALRANYDARIVRLLADAPEHERAAYLGAFRHTMAAELTKASALGQLQLLLDMYTCAWRPLLSLPVARPAQVLLLAARDDTGFSPAEREALLACYPGASVYVFERGGHLAGVMHRAAYVAAIGRFLSAS